MNVEWKVFDFTYVWACLPYKISSVYWSVEYLCGTVSMKFHVGNCSGAWEAVLSCCCCTSPLSPSGGAWRSQWAVKRRTCCNLLCPTVPVMRAQSQQCLLTWSLSLFQKRHQGIKTTDSIAAWGRAPSLKLFAYQSYSNSSDICLLIWSYLY